VKFVAVEFHVLGQLEVWIDGRPVDVGHARQRCVLAVLVVEVNRVVTVEQLLDRVWDDQLPYRARRVVSTYASRLRQLLHGHAPITRRGGGYVLEADPQSVDLHRFRHLLEQARTSSGARALTLLEDAARLWRGEAFEGLDTPWIATVREGLARQRYAADTERVDLALVQGRHAPLTAELVERADAHPLDERVAAQLMLALYRGGRQAEALTRFEEIRTRLAVELGADPGPGLRALHRQILVADPDLTPAVAAPDVPRQLPAPPRSFSGRQAELAHLDRAAEQGHGSMLISAIGGTGGIGKTWLALAWAHHHVHRFPDGQLFVDLRGFSPDSAPMNPAIAVRGFLDALGVEPARLPIDLHAQTALFRSLVSHRRMLIVLDNAADTEQVTPLLPGGTTCTVVVTSRTRLARLITAHEACHLRLDVLTEAESHDLLTSRIGLARTDAEPDAVAEIQRLCGGFPLALSIVAGRARTERDRPLAALADDLRNAGLHAFDDDEPAAALPTVLSWSHQALSPVQARAFALVAAAPGPDIGAHAAADLLGLPYTEAAAVLRGLEHASLLMFDASGRYRMHDLIRRYAAEHPAPDREAAVRRVIDFYLHTAYTAERLLDPHRPPINLAPPPHCHPYTPADANEALAWFSSEHTNLLAAQTLAVERGLHTHVWQLAWTLYTFHLWRGHLQTNVEVWRTALAAASQLDDPATRVLAHRLLGDTAIYAGMDDEAMTNLNLALTLAEATDDLTGQALVHDALTRAWGGQGQSRRALDHATRALHLYQRLGVSAWEAGALNLVGWYEAEMGDHSSALTHCREALTLARRHYDHDLEAAVLDSLGYIAHHVGDHEQALEHYEQALKMYRDAGDAYYEAGTLDHLGETYDALGERDAARACWQQALELYQAQQRDEEIQRVKARLHG
jgi:DNA-binding SARP family transcriptional activator/tetratricopeptide (TPR) repeat protein